MLNNNEYKHFSFKLVKHDEVLGDYELLGSFRSLKDARDYAKYLELGQYEIIVCGTLKVLNGRAL